MAIRQPRRRAARPAAASGGASCFPTLAMTPRLSLPTPRLLPGDAATARRAMLNGSGQRQPLQATAARPAASFPLHRSPCPPANARGLLTPLRLGSRPPAPQRRQRQQSLLLTCRLRSACRSAAASAMPSAAPVASTSPRCDWAQHQILSASNPFLFNPLVTADARRRQEAHGRRRRQYGHVGRP